MWPAIVVDESLIGERKGLKKFSGERSVFVQFFGTHDFARLVILSRFKEIVWCGEGCGVVKDITLSPMITFLMW